MQDDLSAIRKGQVPVGIEMQKSKTDQPAPIAPSVKPPVTPTPSRPSIQVQLGKTQAAKPLNQPGITIPIPRTLPPQLPSKITAPIPGKTTSGVTIPQPGSSGIGVDHKNIYLLIIAGIIVLGVAGYFVYNNYLATEATPTPVASTATPTPTPVLSDLEKILGPEVETISIPPGENPYTSINQFKQSAGQGQLTFYKVNDGSSDLSFIGFLDRFLINHASEFNGLNDKNGSYLAISGALPGVGAKTATGIFVVVKNIEEIKIGMTKWETTAPTDLKTLFGIDPTKKASPTFLDNSYQGVAIRYMNFPTTNTTIDYALVTTANGSTFLLITSSKALIYSLIDIILSSQR